MTTATPDVSPGAPGGEATEIDDPATRDAWQKLRGVRTYMESRLLERGDVIDLALIAVLSGEHLFQWARPGTAKSMLMDVLVSAIRHDAQRPAPHFKILMGQGTTFDDLVGPPSLQSLKRDEYRFITANKLPEAWVALLDEIWEAPQGVSNMLLMALNERAFQQGEAIVPIPLNTAFLASNKLPDIGDGKAVVGQAAIWDRIGLRAEVKYLSDDGFTMLLRRAADREQHKLRRLQAEARAFAGSDQGVTHPYMTLDDLALLQDSLPEVVVDDSIVQALGILRKGLAGKQIEVTDRRFDGAIGILQAHALLHGRVAVGEDDLTVLNAVLWQKPEDRETVSTLIGKLRSPALQKSKDILEQARQTYERAITALNDKNLSPTDRSNAAVDAVSGFRDHRAQSVRLLSTAESAAARTPARVLDQIREHSQQIERWHLEISGRVTAGQKAPKVP